MDQRELIGDRTESFNAMLDGRQSKIWTLMPGILQSFDAAKMTCTVQVALMGKQLKKDGTQVDIQIPILVDCPIQFPSGGGFTLTFSPKKGDECEVRFASRCIDAWWQSGGVQPQQEFRMHDLSDGFVTVGVWSQPNVLPSIKDDAVQLRNTAGDAYYELNSSKIAKVVAPGGINLNGVIIDQDGNMSGVKDFTNTGNTSLSGGSKKVALDGDAVVAGAVVASSTKVKAT